MEMALDPRKRAVAGPDVEMVIATEVAPVVATLTGLVGPVQVKPAV
jgi:hypothetical protein